MRLAGQRVCSKPETMQGLNRVKIDVQVRMLKEVLGRFRKPVEEDVYCPVDLVVELIHDCSVEKPVEQPAVNTPGVAVPHQAEAPRTSHSEMRSCLSVQSQESMITHTVHSA